MEIACEVNSQSSVNPSGDVDHYSEDTEPHSNNEDVEQKCDISDEEARGIMEVIAATGKYWHDWDILKMLLSFQLKQVLAQYPESQIDSGSGSQQSSLSGETFTELANRLDEALLSFTEGPPFTLQRLCEILLAPKSIYPNLSKLALALEKNLLVTSALTRCTEPYPPAMSEKADSEEGNKEIQIYTNPVQNGNETLTGNGDGDEEMADVETEDNNINTDSAMQEDKICELPESNAEPSTPSDPSEDVGPSSEQQEVTISSA